MSQPISPKWIVTDAGLNLLAVRDTQAEANAAASEIERDHGRDRQRLGLLGTRSRLLGPHRPKHAQGCGPLHLPRPRRGNGADAHR